MTTKQAVSGLRIADLNKVYLAVFGKRPRQHSHKSELIEQVSSKLFENDEVGDIVPPLAHSLPHATLTEDDTTEAKSAKIAHSRADVDWWRRGILTENTRQR